MREPSNRRKSTGTLQRSGHTKSKMIVLNAVHRFRVWSVHLSAPWRARQGGAGIQLCPPTIVVFNSFFNGCEIQNSHCMPWRYCLELFFSLYAFAWQSQESSFHSVSQSVSRYWRKNSARKIHIDISQCSSKSSDTCIASDFIFLHGTTHPPFAWNPLHEQLCSYIQLATVIVNFRKCVLY